MAFNQNGFSDKANQMTVPIFRPYVFLRCKKCNSKTDHVLVSITNVKKGEVQETFECQECGETKIIYELASVTQLQNQLEA
jgi:transcription elongation factor Elf1